jgi:hypothetical protein
MNPRMPRRHAISAIIHPFKVMQYREKTNTHATIHITSQIRSSKDWIPPTIKFHDTAPFRVLSAVAFPTEMNVLFLTHRAMIAQKTDFAVLSVCCVVKTWRAIEHHSITAMPLRYLRSSLSLSTLLLTRTPTLLFLVHLTRPEDV